MTRIKWDHFDSLATGKSNIHRKIKETLWIRGLKLALNENIGSDKLLLLLRHFSLSYSRKRVDEAEHP